MYTLVDTGKKIESLTNLNEFVPQKRYKSLDIIRALAVILVVINHLYPLSTISNSVIFKIIRKIFYILTTGGWIGVDLFFVLSGFLVSGLLFEEYNNKGKIDSKTFLIRRGFKIYPSFFIFIITTLIIDRLFFYNSFHHPIDDYVKDLTFLHNYLGGRWAHTWSLDVEEAFYLCLLTLILLFIKIKRLNLTSLMIVYISLLISGIIFRYISNLEYPNYSFSNHFGKTHFRLDALFFGVLICYLYKFKSNLINENIIKYKSILIPISLTILALNFIFEYWRYNFISIILLSVNPIAFGILILMSLNIKSRFYNNKILTFIGKNSYSIYLWHVPINIYILEAFKHFNITAPFDNTYAWLFYIISYITLSLLIGVIFTEVVEKQALKIRNKLYPSKLA